MAPERPINGAPDIGDMDTQDLEKIMDGKLPHPADALAEEAEEAAPDEQEAVEEPEPEEPQEAAPQEPDTADLIEELRSRLEEESLRREQLQLRMDHERLLREQANTRAGNYKEVAVDLARERRARREEFEDPDYPEPVREEQGGPAPLHPEVIRLRQEVMRLSEDATTRAANDALSDFVSSRPELAEDTEDSRDLLAEIEPLVRRGRQEYSSLFETGSPRIVRETSKLILQSALTEVRAGRLAEARQNREARRVEQFSAARQAKLNAGAVASAPASSPMSRPKTPQDMSLEELTARLDEMAPPPRPRQRR